MMLVADFIIVFEIFISTIILILLINAKKDKPKNLLLIYFVFVLGLNVCGYASLHKLSDLYALTFTFDFLFLWLLGPILFIYARLIVGLPVDNNYLIHLLPSILLGLVLAIPFSISFLNIGFYPAYLKVLDKHQLILIPLRDVYCLSYILLAYRNFSNFNIKRELSSNNMKTSNLVWIRILIILSFLLVIFDLLFNLYELATGSLLFHPGFWMLLYLCISSVYLAYFGIRQSNILLPDFLMHRSTKQKRVTRLGNLSLHGFEEEFRVKMKIEKYYLDEQLTLQKLAGYFNKSDKQISLLLNEYLGLSFYEYINSLRVEEVKSKLNSRSYDHYTIVALAYESGFKSKATFNRIFKQTTGMTPSQYRSSHR